MSNEYNSGITSRGHRGSEKSPRQPSPSPPAVSPVSASTSTPSPSGTTRSGPPFYTSSPPSYSSLVDRDDSQALATHYLTSTGDNSGIIRTPGKVHSDQKGNRSTNEEEEVEDRAELTRMIGISFPTAPVFPKYSLRRPFRSFDSDWERGLGPSD